MIIQSHRKPDILLPDMTFWTMTINQPVTEVYKNYKVLCPTILFAEIYNHVQGANKRLKNPFEVLCITPWQILVKNELEGQPITQGNNIAPVHLKSEQNMDIEEKDVVESAKKLVETFDEVDRCLYAQPPTLKGRRENALVSFANADYQKLTWDQFIRKFKKISRETIFESVPAIVEMPTTSKNTARTAIENVLSEYETLYPINNFKKAFAFSKLILEDDFIGVCNRIFIPMLENHLGLDRTHWDNTRDKLTRIAISVIVFLTLGMSYVTTSPSIFIRMKTLTTQRLGQEILSIYTTFISVMFYSFLRTHNMKEYVTGAGMLKSNQ